jgi:hypothetical protein
MHLHAIPGLPFHNLVEERFDLRERITVLHVDGSYGARPQAARLAAQHAKKKMQQHSAVLPAIKA